MWSKVVFFEDFILVAFDSRLSGLSSFSEQGVSWFRSQSRKKIDAFVSKRMLSLMFSVNLLFCSWSSSLYLSTWNSIGAFLRSWVLGDAGVTALGLKLTWSSLKTLKLSSNSSLAAEEELFCILFCWFILVFRFLGDEKGEVGSRGGVWLWGSIGLSGLKGLVQSAVGITFARGFVQGSVEAPVHCFFGNFLQCATVILCSTLSRVYAGTGVVDHMDIKVLSIPSSS